MAIPSNSKSSRGGMSGKNKKAASAKRVDKSTSRRPPQKLDDVSDAPESGEPREQGRSRGRVIERPAGNRGAKSGRATSSPKRSAGGKAAAGANDPLAAAERDESGSTRNEAWESGRQKAMED